MEPDIHLNWAAWSSLDSGIVSFTRDWNHRKHPELWWGKDKLPFKSLRRMSVESYGLQGGYFGRGDSFFFILPEAMTHGVNLESGLYLSGSFNGWEAAIGNPEWCLGEGMVKDQACHLLQVPKAMLEHEKAATFKYVTGDGHWIEVPEHTPNTHVDGLGIKNYLFSSNRSGRHLFRFKTPLSLNQADDRKLYFRVGTEVESIRLSPGVYLKTLEASGPLGATVTADDTTFRIFAPRARHVWLHLYRGTESDDGETIPMEFTGDLVWEARIPGNRHGWFYHYTVEGQETDEAGYFNPDFHVLDPYAKAVCGPRGPGIVVEDSFFKQEPVAFKAPYWHDLVIAEAHVRDLAAMAPVEMADEERSGFSGLAAWVDSDAFYLEALGVNAVELQPVHEFDTVDKAEYAWGYMPVNYFSPASQYCRQASKLDQIQEFRDLVQGFHRKGIAVILDVVYNHVGEPNYLQFLDREYYFLLTKDGHFENFSGCGNTLDANAPMVRRLILDSLVHWIKAFDVDGFRFDLGELIGKEAFSWLEPRLKKVKPELILIAEPWSFRGHIGRELKETGFASWNDEYREYIRSYVTGQADAGGLPYFLAGSRPDWSRFPAQSVNYVESHDDRCWIDKITENPNHDGAVPTARDRRRTHLMISIQMMSLGIPMLASGIDMMKSKGGFNNSYLRGDLNALDYSRLLEFPGTVDYIRKWLAFRTGDLGRLVRLDTYPGNGYFYSHVSGSAMGMVYNHDHSHGGKRLLYVVNSGFATERLELSGAGLDACEQIADAERWGDPVLQAPLFKHEGDAVWVPPLSCGLFMERE